MVHPEARLNDFEVSSGAETVRVARSLAAHGAFADPFASMATGTTAHVAPVYPFLYSLILRGFGTGYTALQIAWILSLALFALQLALLVLLSDGLKIGLIPGISAALLGTASLYAPIDTRWESFLAGTLLVVTYLATDWALRREDMLRALGAGGLWGITILTNPLIMVLLVAWPAVVLSLQPQEQRHPNKRHVAIIAFTALVIVSPWIVRNYLRFGAFIFVRDNLGLELYTGNNPCAAPDLKTNIQSGCHARTHPNPNSAVGRELAGIGEVAFNRAKLREALDWMNTHRADFLRLTMRRARLFWFPTAERMWESVLVWTITLLSVLGLWVLVNKNQPMAWIIAATWVLFPLIYYLVPFEPRYRYPIYWTSLLPAGCLLDAGWKKLRGLRLAGQSAVVASQDVAHHQ